MKTDLSTGRDAFSGAEALTMRHYIRASLQIGLSIALGLLLTGCWMRSMFGHVEIVEDLSEEINLIIDNVFGNGTLAVCGQHGTFYDCTYIVDGEILTSTVQLVSELGLAGVLIDPLIAQVPETVHTITATYDLGSGPQPLIVTNVSRFKITHALSVTAEPGHRFVILEMPPSVEALVPTGVPTNGLPISYTLSYAHNLPLGQPVPPQTIKLMLAGRITITGHKYYVPLLPCVTDFALVPSFTLPVASTPQDLQPALNALTPQPCTGQFYFFNIEPPLNNKLYLPTLIR